MSVFGVFQVCIFPHTDQKNSEYGHFLRCVIHAQILLPITILHSINEYQRPFTPVKYI